MLLVGVHVQFCLEAQYDLSFVLLSSFSSGWFGEAGVRWFVGNGDSVQGQRSSQHSETLSVLVSITPMCGLSIFFFYLCTLNLTS